MSYLSESDKHRIINDPDYVFSKKMQYSLLSALEKYPDGASAKFICRVLNLTPESYSKILKASLKKIKNKM